MFEFIKTEGISFLLLDKKIKYQAVGWNYNIYPTTHYERRFSIFLILIIMLIFVSTESRGKYHLLKNCLFTTKMLILELLCGYYVKI